MFSSETSVFLAWITSVVHDGFSELPHWDVNSCETRFFFFFSSIACMLSCKWKQWLAAIEAEENQSLYHNNSLLSSGTDLAGSLALMFLQSCAAKCVTSVQLTFVFTGLWQRRHTRLCAPDLPSSTFRSFWCSNRIYRCGSSSPFSPFQF